MSSSCSVDGIITTMVLPPTSPDVKPSISRPPARQLPGDFKCPSLKNQATQDVFQSIVKGRKSWKTLRGGEVVWPPELEAALIEGLENYQPDDSRETRLLGRFPMRNRFISDWIFEKTGKRRTAKQVGSRLQQLRDTCGGKRLLKLLSPIRPPSHVGTSPAPPPSPSKPHHNDGCPTFGSPYDSESPSESSVSPPPTPTEAHTALQSLLYRGIEPRVEAIPSTIVYIDLLARHMPAHISGEATWTSSSNDQMEDHSWVERGVKVERASEQPRYLSDIDPTITLTSKTPISAQSHFTVHTDDGVVFSETTTLELLDSSTAPALDDSFLHRTRLIPGFWETIVHSSDASMYTIIQRVLPEASSSTPAIPIFSAMYKFNYMDAQPRPSATQQLIANFNQNHSAANLTIPVSLPHETDYPFDELDLSMSVEPQSFNDAAAFSKNPQLFNFISEEWNSSSPTDSVYPSPVDCFGSTSYTVLGCPVDGQHMLPPPALTSFSHNGLSSYVRAQ